MDTNSIRVARLKALVQAEGGVTEFARRRSSPNADKPIDTSYISQLLNGHRNFGEKSARSMERRAGLPEGYFDGREKIPMVTEQPLVKQALFTANESENKAESVIAHHPDDPLGEDDVLVPEYRVSFSAGPGSAPEYEIVEEAEPAIYKISWFRKERINPKNAKRFKVRHDSMVPLLYPGDTILVNLAENSMANVIDGKNLTDRKSVV